ncbi:NADP(H)-dependent aldo-keto reductase [Gammaproteobacteria bacterium]|nr:NADP(H)-dependent aldo-keto reductase [Gammaproteobacteria bacterium]
MKYNNLGNTDIKVSRICLGSMTWGEQNTPDQAHAQLDLALDMGVNFIDTAEMYAVPSRQETYGESERIIGNWLNKTGKREHIIIATKVVGPCGDWMPHIRNAGTRLDRVNIRAAIEGSLNRLQTDYIDLYQTHWPERSTNYFGQLGYEHVQEPNLTSIEETLGELTELVIEGKVRAIGVSNETPWGVMEYLYQSREKQLDRIVSIQNPYSLLNRSFEVGLAEIAMREQVGLLAYSPLGFGVLTGKYLDKTAATDARLNLPKFKRFTRYTNPVPVKATQLYAAVAQEHGLNFGQMSLAYVCQRPFLTSTVIGATTCEQLKENIESDDLVLSDEVNKAIETVHKLHPNPAP